MLQQDEQAKVEKFIDNAHHYTDASNYSTQLGRGY